MIKQDENGHDMVVIEWRIEDVQQALELTYSDRPDIIKKLKTSDYEAILGLVDKMNPNIDWDTIYESCDNYINDIGLE